VDRSQLAVGRTAGASCDVCADSELNVGYACLSHLSALPPIVTGQLFQSEMYFMLIVIIQLGALAVSATLLRRMVLSAWERRLASIAIIWYR
jgi:hypothetical protein